MTNFELLLIFLIPVRKALILKASDFNRCVELFQKKTVFFILSSYEQNQCYCLIQNNIILECP